MTSRYVPILDRLIQRTVTVLGEQQVQTIWAGRLDFRARDFTREFDFGLLELEDSRWYVRPHRLPGTTTTDSETIQACIGPSGDCQRLTAVDLPSFFAVRFPKACAEP